MTVILGYATSTQLIIGGDGRSTASSSQILTDKATKVFRLCRPDGTPFALVGVSGLSMLGDQLRALEALNGHLEPFTNLGAAKDNHRTLASDHPSPPGLVNAILVSAWLTDLAKEFGAVDDGLWSGGGLLVQPGGVWYLGHYAATPLGNFGACGSGDDLVEGYVAGRLSGHKLDGHGPEFDEIALVMDALDWTASKLASCGGTPTIITLDL